MQSFMLKHMKPFEILKGTPEEAAHYMRQSFILYCFLYAKVKDLEKDVNDGEKKEKDQKDDEENKDEEEDDDDEDCISYICPKCKQGTFYGSKVLGQTAYGKICLDDKCLIPLVNFVRHFEKHKDSFVIEDGEVKQKK